MVAETEGAVLTVRVERSSSDALSSNVQTPSADIPRRARRFRVTRSHVADFFKWIVFPLACVMAMLAIPLGLPLHERLIAAFAISALVLRLDAVWAFSLGVASLAAIVVLRAVDERTTPEGLAVYAFYFFAIGIGCSLLSYWFGTGSLSSSLSLKRKEFAPIAKMEAIKTTRLELIGGKGAARVQ